MAHKMDEPEQQRSNGARLQAIRVVGALLMN